MYSIDEIKNILEARLSEHRFNHTESVVQTAIDFAMIYQDQDSEINTKYIEKIELAAYLHDSCKELKNEELLTLAEFYKIKIFAEDRSCPNLLHARVGAAWVEEEFEICDPYILHAIRDHTFGSENMFLSSKILFLADMLEPKRKHQSQVNKELRTLIKEKTDINQVLLKAMNHKLGYVLNKNQILHPLGVTARNFLAAQLNFVEIME